MNDRNLTLNQVQKEVSEKNCALEIVFAMAIMKIQSKYKAMLVFLLLTFISVIAGFLTSVIPLNLKMVIFISVIWISAITFHYFGEIVELRHCGNQLRKIKFDIALAVFYKWELYDSTESKERDKVFENDIAPYAGLQRNTELDNQSEDE